MALHPTARGEILVRSLPSLRPFHRRVFLIRHGQTDWNMKGLMQGGGFDIELNQNGIEQAERVNSELSGIPFNVIASSHLQRAIQTSLRIHASSNKIQRLVDKRFGEMRFGDFEGTVIHGPGAKPENRKRYKEMLTKMESDIHLPWPGKGGESTFDVSKRGKAALENLLDNYPDEEHICVVAHGRFNKVLLSTLLWGDCSRYPEIEQGNTCINVIDYSEEDETWTPVLINYVDHAPNANAKKALADLVKKPVLDDTLSSFNSTATNSTL